MKKLILIITIILTVLAGLWLSTQSYSQVKFPDKSIKFDTATLNTVKERGLDKKSTTELAVKVVQQSDSISVQKDSIVAKEQVIKDLKLKVPPKDSGLGAWINYLIGLLSIIVIWALSFIKKLSTSNIPLFQRLAGEASGFVKKIQGTCVAIAALIPMLMGSIEFSTTVISILGTVEIICLAITGFSLFLVKNSNDIKVKVPEVKEETK